MSAIAAAQWTAVATIVLAVFAVIGAGFAVAAFRAQGQQVSALKDQVKAQQDLNEKQTPVLELQARELRESLEQRIREAEARRRAQASHVFLGLEPVGLNMPTGRTAHIANDSNEPIYDAQVRWHRGTAADGSDEPVPMVLPHEEVHATHGFPPDTNMEYAGAVLVFRDAAGITWRRRLDGTLTELGD